MALSDEVPHHICQSSYTTISIFLHVIWTPICNYKIMRIFLYYIKKKKEKWKHVYVKVHEFAFWCMHQYAAGTGVQGLFTFILWAINDRAGILGSSNNRHSVGVILIIIALKRHMKQPLIIHKVVRLN